MNNLYLSQRGVDIMSILASRSGFWRGISKDLNDHLSKCEFCNNQLQVNPAQPRLPMDDQVYFHYQKLSIDICETLYSNEHVLVICDYFSGYVWAAKSGNREFEIASKMAEILKRKNRNRSPPHRNN